jgi:hypothetical protein
LSAYAATAFSFPRKFLVFVSVIGSVNPTAKEWLEALGK